MGPRLVVWAPCLCPNTSHLPTLDPDSLFAASIFQARRVNGYSLCAPSSLIHSRVPCLEETATGVILTQDIEGLERYAQKHSIDSINGGSLLDEDNVTGEEGEIDDKRRRHRWAQRKALEQYLLSTLHPLIHQILFSQELYSSHTSKAYISGLSILNRGSLISRLRKELRQHFAIKAKAIGSGQDSELSAILAESNAARYIREEDNKERQDLAERGGISRNGKKKSRLAGLRGDGLLQEEKASAARAFSEMRLRAYASKLFDCVAESLGNDEYFFSSKRPSLLDIRIFSLLAPMLLPASTYTSLAKSSIPLLLRSEYPTLVKHTERVQTLIWPMEIQPQLGAHSTYQQGDLLVTTSAWPDLIGREDEQNNRSMAPPQPLTVRVASSLGRIAGQTYYYASSLMSSAKPTDNGESRPAAASGTSTTAQVSAAAKPRVMTEAERKEARRVAIGRWIWISSALIGMIGTAFASGLLAIEYDNGEEEDEDNNEGDGEQEIVDLVKAKLDEADESEEEVLDDAATELSDDEYEVEIIEDDDDDRNETEQDIADDEE